MLIDLYHELIQATICLVTTLWNTSLEIRPADDESVPAIVNGTAVTTPDILAMNGEHRGSLERDWHPADAPVNGQARSILCHHCCYLPEASL